VMNAKPTPNVSDAITCALASGIAACRPALVTARSSTLKKTSSPPANAVAARATGERASLRSPSSSPSSQISSGERPLMAQEPYPRAHLGTRGRAALMRGACRGAACLPCAQARVRATV
jgi:hypothetical protein